MEKVECPSIRPITLRIGGPSPTEDDVSLVFTPAFPCGVERDAAFTATMDAPLVRIATFSTCLGAGMPDGSLVLVRGQALALDSQRGPGVIDSLTIDACQPNAYRSVPRVKLEIQSCGADPVIIDSDSEIVVPAGPAMINVLAPGPRVGPPVAPAHAWIRGRTTLAAQTAWTDLTLRIFACPLVCCYCPEGVLSEWSRAIDTTLLANRILLRPHRARRLEVAAIDGGTLLPTTLSMRWLADVAGGTSIGGTVWPSTFGTLNMIGAAPAVEFIGIPATVRYYVRWEVR